MGELTLLGCVAVEGAAQNFNGMLNNSTLEFGDAAR
jgi:hypothetical protein